ncbi:uncharacterized protein TNCV_2129111 [Trichonephila clavipes]|nr:uncharacterized protein TNCV_2129111 [Trichonephila clavipes]
MKNSLDGRHILGLRTLASDTLESALIGNKLGEKNHCGLNSVQRHFQTKHQDTFKNSDEKYEALEKAVSEYKKEITFLCQTIGVKPKATECSFVIAHCLAAKGKPFTDGEYIKNTFLKSAEILFIDLPNLRTILSRIQEIPASAENVTAKQNSGLQESVAFSIGLDESKDVCVNELHALQ